MARNIPGRCRLYEANVPSLMFGSGKSKGFYTVGNYTKLNLRTYRRVALSLPSYHEHGMGQGSTVHHLRPCIRSMKERWLRVNALWRDTSIYVPGWHNRVTRKHCDESYARFLSTLIHYSRAPRQITGYEEWYDTSTTTHSIISGDAGCDGVTR